MYIIKNSGKFTCAERGIITRKWASRDINGRIMVFDTKAAALAAIASQENSQYDGILSRNILSHGQLSGDVPVAMWCSRLPRWAES